MHGYGMKIFSTLSIATCLEGEPQAELDFSLREYRSEAQGLARRKSTRSLHVECGESRCQTEKWAHLIVHTGKVGMVGDVEALGGKLQFCLLANFMLPAQAHIEIDVVRAKSGVATGSERTFIGVVIVAVDLTAGQQIERMSTVLSKNGS